jgi:hypothetical protein
LHLAPLYIPAGEGYGNNQGNKEVKVKVSTLYLYDKCSKWGKENNLSEVHAEGE